MIAVGMGNQDMTDFACPDGDFQRCDMAGQIGAGVNNRHLLASADDIDTGALEGERSGIGRQQPLGPG